MHINRGVKRSETHRVRQVHRYLGAWREVQALLYGPPSSQSSGISTDADHKSVPKASSDKALTAFAQLSTLRLNVSRAVISLIDTDTQFILAEATQTISLMKESRHDSGDQLAFGKSNVPQAESICSNTFDSVVTVSDSGGKEVSINAFTLHNALEDERHKDNAMVQQHQIKFYASVPIVTTEGVEIGAYSIMSSDLRSDLTFSEYQFLQDVSSTVFEHLVLVRDRLNSVTGAKLVNGLTDFISRNDTTSTDTEEVGASHVADRGDGLLQDTSDSGRDSLISTRSLAKRRGPQSQQTPLDQSHASSPVSITTSTSSTIEEDLKTMFGRAAKSLQMCTGSNGCVFLEVSLDDAQVDLSHLDERDQKSDTASNNSLKRIWNAKEDKYESSIDSPHDTQSESDINTSSDANDNSKKASTVLGSSFQLRGKADGDSGFPTFVCTERDLKRCIRRYPGGKIFNFTDEGMMSSGEDTLSDQSQPYGHNPSKPSAVKLGIPPPKRHRHPTRVRKFVAEELVKIIPGVRSVIFLPLWDFNQSRWYAGLFIWTTELGRFMDTNDEFPYIRAFGNTIMNEVSRLTAVHAERAKTTFIASISHELRSPLHGILGSVEFLLDTRLDSFQRGLIGSVETCGKTLLDTIDHVLDYAKINYFGLLESRAEQTVGRRSQRSRAGLASHTNRTLNFNIGTLVEEVIEAVYAGQTFRQSKADAPDDVFDDSSMSRTTSGNLAQESIESPQASKHLRRFANGMTIVLDIDISADCVIISQPGALRRVVMNLFGNALKYSNPGKGLIKVTLRRSTQATKVDHGEVPIELLISDTGRGMSADYLRHKLYRPFSQEDPFSVGTGLGLSIVRQIITSLKGKIRISSEQGRGTDISVNLKLPRLETSHDHERGHISGSLLKMTTGLSVGILEPGESESDDQASRSSMTSALRKMLTMWFGMSVHTTSDMDENNADFYIYPEPPPIESLLEKRNGKNRSTEEKLKTAPLIIICTNAFEEAALKASGLERLTTLGWAIEVISQPCGPSKMARAFESCFQSLESYIKPARSRSESNKGVSNTGQVQRASDLSEPTRDELEPTSPAEPITKTESSQTSTTRHDDGILFQNNDSSENKIELPSREQNPKSDDPNSTPSIEHASSTEKVGPSILLVDDNAVNLQLLVAFMNKLSLPYTSAGNGQEALESYQKQFEAGRPFDYILMDINMPVMDGFTSTREIRHFERQHGSHKAVIAALTGMAGQSIQEEAFQIGFDHYFSKPVRFKELKRLMLGD